MYDAPAVNYVDSGALEPLQEKGVSPSACVLTVYGVALIDQHLALSWSSWSRARSFTEDNSF